MLHAAAGDARLHSTVRDMHIRTKVIVLSKITQTSGVRRQCTFCYLDVVKSSHYQQLKPKSKACFPALKLPPSVHLEGPDTGAQQLGCLMLQRSQLTLRRC